MLGELQKQKLTKVFRIWDTDGNGFLELEDWTRVERKRAELAGISPGTPEYENVRRLYTLVWETLRESADTNRDERVSLDEFLTFCDKQWGHVQEVSFEALPDQVRAVLGAIVNSVDRDNDGKITSEDHRIFLSGWVGRDVSSEAKASFAARDLDRDGYISIEEAKQHVAEFMLSNDPAATGNSLLD